MTIKGKTKTGFEFEVDKGVLSDARFLELFAYVAENPNDALRYFKLISLTLGEGQKERLFAYCKDENGHVPIERVGAEFADVFTVLREAAETKN